MRILYLTHNLSPEPGATKRPLKQACVLIELGHDVTIVAGFPHYPHGRIFAGYRNRLRMRERIDDVDVVRVWSPPAASQGIVWRMFAFATFWMSAGFASLFLPRPDVVFVSTTLPLSELAGLLIARMRGARLVLELRDLMPEKLKLLGLAEDGLAGRFFLRYFNFFYRRAAILALAEKYMAAALTARGVVEPALLPLPHAVDFADLAAGCDERGKLGLKERYVLVYAGSFSPHYRLPFLLAVARRLGEDLPQVCFLLVGAGPDLPLMRKTVAEDGLTNVLLTGGLDPELVPGYLHTADAFIHPQLLDSITDGTKIAEYLAVGRPILNICFAPESFGQAEELGVGRSAPLGDVQAFCEAVRFYMTHPLESARAAAVGRKFAITRLDRRAVVRDFERQMRTALFSPMRGPDARLPDDDLSGL